MRTDRRQHTHANLLEHVKQKLPRMGAEKRELPRAISFRVNYVSENTSAHNAHQKPTDNTRTDADLLRARRFYGNYGQRNAKGKREGGENTPNALCVGTRHANMHVIHGAPYTEGFEVYERYLHFSPSSDDKRTSDRGRVRLIRIFCVAQTLGRLNIHPCTGPRLCRRRRIPPNDQPNDQRST
jgi:hypothetical protein